MSHFVPLFFDLWRRFGSRLILLVFLMVVVGAIEGLAVTLMLPLLMSLGLEGSINESNFLVEQIALLGLSDADRWIPIALLILVVSVLQGGLVVFQGWLQSKIAQGYMAAWKLELFRVFIDAEWSFSVDKQSGELVSAITNETGRLQAAAMSLFGIVTTIIVGTAYLTYGLLISVPLTLSVLVLSGIIVLTLSGLYRKSADAGARMGKSLSDQQSLISECLRGVKTIKAATMELRAVGRLRNIVANLEHLGVTASFIPSLVRGVFESVGLIILVAMIILSVKLFGISFATLLVVLALFVRMVPRLSSLQQFLHSLNAYSPSIGVLMKLKAEAVSRREYQGNFGMSESPSEELVDSLKFERLSVSYKGGSTIGPLTFSIKFPGFTALVGASGSGKSTIVAAILRLVRYEGQIEHGGRAIEEFDIRRWRNHLGYVPQDPMFFHASIRDNLCITRENATDEEIAESLKIACLDDFISELPDGLDTVIGDQGSRLSGGQRQRLGIARSILSKPKILLLDEATSSLDPNLEQEILAQLNILKKSIGIIFVAHSLSPIQTADSVVVMHQGKLQDIGTWQELVERSDIFRTVINHGMRVSEQR